MAAMGQQVIDAGGAIVEVLETTWFGVSSRSDLDAWVNTYRLPVTSVIDDPARAPALQTFNALGQREEAYVIDLRTMRIISRIQGSVAGIGTPSAKTAMEQLLQLLGP